MTHALRIAEELQIASRAVEKTIALLEDGATVPFISRYRKEATGGLDEVQIENIRSAVERYKEVDDRRATIIKQIESQGKMTDELRARLEQTFDLPTLEDLYLPYKPKRKTRATKARELGLQPLADALLGSACRDALREAQRYVGEGVPSAEAAIEGAKDIIAEYVTDQPDVRQAARNVFRRQAEVSVGIAKGHEADAAKYVDHVGRSETLSRCPSHRLLALLRGEAEGVLNVSIDLPEPEQLIARISRPYTRNRSTAEYVEAAILDGYKRLLAPSIATEMRKEAKTRADKEAIEVFRTNLRQLLLAAPFGHHRVLALDPGFRTGCKVVCLDEKGDMLCHSVIYPHPPVSKVAEATKIVSDLVSKYHLEAVAIGNGTASRETEAFVRSHPQAKDLRIFVVSEDGASIYSASATAREEFPNEDVTVRGAVSIGRRLIDPLSELVKIDPKSLGVGQYQHDVDQTMLHDALDSEVVNCVNQVGVDVNTASRHLLAYVSGLNAQTAQNIVDYRSANGAFETRSQLKKVPRLGPKAFEQCAGFLRIPGAKNPLDASAVHPERYDIVSRMASDLKCTVSQLVADATLRQRIKPEIYVSADAGLPTINDILAELEKPGRDPRQSIVDFAFDDTVHSIDDLREGMILPGIVTNITAFGAFVDIGVKTDGLVHISAVSDKFVRDVASVLALHQHVRVSVLSVDRERGRISLSMKGVPQT